MQGDYDAVQYQIKLPINDIRLNSPFARSTNSIYKPVLVTSISRISSVNKIKNAIRQINIRNIFKYPKQFGTGKTVWMTVVLWHSCCSRRIYWNTALAAGPHKKQPNSRIYLLAKFTYIRFGPLSEIGNICHFYLLYFSKRIRDLIKKIK